MTPSLGAQAEEVWTVLATHAEWSDGFWLVWLLTDRPDVDEALRQRLQARGELRILELRRAAEVETLLETLLRDVGPATWLRAIGPEQEDAWVALHRRLNERREQLKASLPAGIVLSGPVGLKEAVRSAAPDLWSIRSAVLEVTERRPGWERRADAWMREEHELGGVVWDEALAAEFAERAEQANDLRGFVAASLRRVPALMFRDRVDEALGILWGLQRLDLEEDERFDVLQRITGIYLYTKDNAAALDAVKSMTHLADIDTPRRIVGKLWEARAFGALGKKQSALRLLRESVATARKLRQPHFLAVVLSMAGDDWAELGADVAARSALEEALRLPSTPDTIEYLPQILQRAGSFYRSRGETETSLAILTRAASAARQIGDDEAEARIRLEHASALLDAHRNLEAWQLFTEDLNHNAPPHSPHLWRTCLGAAHAARQADRVEQALALAEHALTLVRQTAVPRLARWPLSLQRNLLLTLHDPAGALAAHTLVLALQPDDGPIEISRSAISPDLLARIDADPESIRREAVARIEARLQEAGVDPRRPWTIAPA